MFVPSIFRWPSGIERLLLHRQTWGSIPSRVKPMTLKLVFTASLLDVQHLRDSVEKAGEFTCCAVGKMHYMEILHLSVVDSWPATPKRARTALRRFLAIGG